METNRANNEMNKRRTEIYRRDGEKKKKRENKTIEGGIRRKDLLHCLFLKHVQTRKCLSHRSHSMCQNHLYQNALNMETVEQNKHVYE